MAYDERQSYGDRDSDRLEQVLSEIIAQKKELDAINKRRARSEAEIKRLIREAVRLCNRRVGRELSRAGSDYDAYGVGGF